MTKKYLFIISLTLVTGISAFVFYFFWNGEVMCGMNEQGKLNISWVKPAKEEEVLLTEDTKKCPVHQEECRIELSENEWISLDITPRPVETSKVVEFRVKVSSDKIVPEDIDLTGTEINMGYFRPKLEKVGPDTYKLDFSVPICEEAEMQWKAIVRYKEKGAGAVKKGAAFYFMSYQK